MQWLWVIYWPVIILVPLIISIVALRKKFYITGGIEVGLSILVPFFHMYFSVHSNWNGNKQNEFMYLFKQIFSGNIGAILIGLGYLILIGLCIYHFPLITKKR